MSWYSSRYGIIADIHSNLAALRAVLDALAEEDVELILCAGDIVGYGPSPCEVIEALRALPVESIRGNHDRYALGEDSEQIRAATAEAVEYTRRVLTPGCRQFLQGLKDTMLYKDRVLLFHGSLRNRDEYVLTPEAAVASMRLLRSDFAGIYLAFFGHTHLPTFIGNGKFSREVEPGYTVKLKPMTPYIFNPGSVGQPRDGNPDAAYAVLDLAERTLTFRRVPYNIDDTRQKVLEAGLQRHLGDRLRLGK